MLIDKQMIGYGPVEQPISTGDARPVTLTDGTMQEHKNRVIERMEENNFDVLVIYGDREHGANYGYLTGFEPRFEESILVLHRNGDAYLLLGNEAMKMARFCRLPVTPIHVPQFSLPNQPMDNEESLEAFFLKTGIDQNKNVGVVGWKLFTGSTMEHSKTYDVPHFIVQALAGAAGSQANLQNATHLFIHPDTGARVTVNANEIAHYEFGSSIASNRILALLNQVELGKTEVELADILSAFGQHLSVHRICATGERFTHAEVAPRNKQVVLGDAFSATMGLRGGLTYRSGYVVHTEKELASQFRDYLDRVAKPYFFALATWYSTIKIGLEAGELYQTICAVAPQHEYGWELNPGHLTSSDEWMSSPVYPGSKIKFRSGMMLQADIIFGVPGYAGSSAEDGVVLADKELRSQLESKYPLMWDRMVARRHYMQRVLGIPLHEEVLPMSDICGYLRPFLLAKDKALYVRT